MTLRERVVGGAIKTPKYLEILWQLKEGKSQKVHARLELQKLAEEVKAGLLSGEEDGINSFSSVWR